MWDLCDKLNDYRLCNNHMSKSFKWTPVSCGQEYFIQVWCIYGTGPRSWFSLNHVGEGSPKARVKKKTCPMIAMQGIEPISAALTVLWVMLKKFHTITHDGEHKNITSSSHLQAISFGRVHFYSMHTKCDSLTGWRKSIYRVKQPNCQSVPWWLCESASSAASMFAVPSPELGKRVFFFPQRQKCKKRPWIMISSTYSRPSVGLFYKTGKPWCSI